MDKLYVRGDGSFPNFYLDPDQQWTHAAAHVPSGPITLVRRRASLYPVLSVLVVFIVAVWLSGHLRPNPVLHQPMLFVHLVSLVLGFGAVLVADYYGLLFVIRRVDALELTTVVGRLHLPIWAGVGGLILSGILLEPALDVARTRVKLVLVLVLLVNGVRTAEIGRRLSEAGSVIPRRLFTRAMTAASVSQLCWWSAIGIGFLNTSAH